MLQILRSLGLLFPAFSLGGPKSSPRGNVACSVCVWKPLEDRRMLSVGGLNSDLDAASGQTIEMFHAQTRSSRRTRTMGCRGSQNVYFGYNKGERKSTSLTIPSNSGSFGGS